MGRINLKTDIHRLVDKIENEQLLEVFYDFLVSHQNNSPSEFWLTLTEEQKKEVLLSYAESEDDSNLMDKDELFKRK
jgi:hypothetical protein